MCAGAGVYVRGLTSTLVLPGTQTGAESSLRIHVSISLTSCITILGTPSWGRPVITLHTVSLEEANTGRGKGGCYEEDGGEDGGTEMKDEEEKKERRDKEGKR